MKWLFSIIVSLFFLYGCETTSPQSNEDVKLDSEWAVPFDEVRDGGVGRDGIPSIDRPSFSRAIDQQVLFDHEMISGVLINGEAVAFPHKILDYHEIVNAEHQGFSYALSFCPLTGTSMVYPRELKGEQSTYGVSGLLYNSNLILYDRLTGSFWSQMLFSSVNGELKGETVPFIQVIETTWETWRNWYPETLVLDSPNGKPRSYDEYAYGGYRTNHDLILFPPKNDFTGIPRKERILGVVNVGRMYYFRFNQFENGVTYRSAVIGDKEIMIFADQASNYMFAFEKKSNSGSEIRVNKILTDQAGGLLFEDTEGTVWSVFGEAVSGPGRGDQLRLIKNFVGYSFAMAAFYPNDFFER